MMYIEQMIVQSRVNILQHNLGIRLLVYMYQRDKYLCTDLCISSNYLGTCEHIYKQGDGYRRQYQRGIHPSKSSLPHPNITMGLCMRMGKIIILGKIQVSSLCIFTNQQDHNWNILLHTQDIISHFNRYLMDTLSSTLNYR